MTSRSAVTLPLFRPMRQRPGGSGTFGAAACISTVLAGNGEPAGSSVQKASHQSSIGGDAGPSRADSVSSPPPTTTRATRSSAATTLTSVLGAARLTVRAAPASGARAANTVYSVFALDTADAPAVEPTYEAGSSEEAGTILPAGKWHVTASDSDGRYGLADIELGVGEHRSLDLSLE